MCSAMMRSISCRVALSDASGRLIEPFNLRIPSQSAYYIVGLPGDLDLPKVRAFSQWLRKELADDGPER
jgi:LysR family glycine cleavage system transcriptional activator